MINVDWSIVPAIAIFLITVIALNYLLFKPVLRVQEEREKRTTGLMSKTRQDLDHHLRLFDQYQATIKNARLEGYRFVDQGRTEALAYRNNLLRQGRERAEQLTREAREQIQGQAAEAKARLRSEAEDIAHRIATTVLQRPA